MSIRYMIYFTAGLIAFFLISVILDAGGDEMKLKVGDTAPDFALPDETGRVRTLQEFTGKKVVLYFYPKDDSPGCTRQACNLRDGFTRLQQAGIVVLGVSYDSPESHRKFKDKYALPFSLLSDRGKDVARAYGAYGRFLGFLMPRRYTYLLDEQGKVVQILSKVDMNSHAEDILAAFGVIPTSP